MKQSGDKLNINFEISNKKIDTNLIHNWPQKGHGLVNT